MTEETEQEIDLDKLQRKFSGEASSEVNKASKSDEKSASSSGAGDGENTDQESQAPLVEEAIVVEPKIDNLGRAYGTGRRKSSVARVWIRPGKGEFEVNKRSLEDYFSRDVLKMVVRQPFGIAGRSDEFSVFCTVKGGGISGQAEAIRHGISRALVAFEPELRPVVKKSGLLTRDAREVERKKYGRRKARRSFQFSKR